MNNNRINPGYFILLYPEVIVFKRGWILSDLFIMIYDAYLLCKSSTLRDKGVGHFWFIIQSYGTFSSKLHG